MPHVGLQQYNDAPSIASTTKLDAAHVAEGEAEGEDDGETVVDTEPDADALADAVDDADVL